MREFLNNLGGEEAIRNRAVVPTRQATQPGGIGSLKSSPGLLKSLKIRALCRKCARNEVSMQFRFSLHRVKNPADFLYSRNPLNYIGNFLQYAVRIL